MVKENEIYTVEIEEGNIFANGICHIDSFVVFVEGAMKGEKCKIQIIKCHSRYAYAKCLEILSKSDDRILPSCAKYEKCGGCSFLHTNIAYENEAKLSFVKSVFAKNKIEASFENTICPLSEGYRNKIVLFYNGNGFGYNEKATNNVIEHTSCALNDEIFDNIAAFTSNSLKNTPIRALFLRKNRDNTEIMVCPIFYKPTNVIEYTTKLLNEFPNVKTVLTASLKDKDFALEKVAFKAVYGDGYITDTLCGLSFKISPKSFYQVNPHCAEMLYEKAIELLNPQNDTEIADLFCGTGTMGIIVAKRTKCKVYGVEIEPSAVKDAKQNAKLNGVYNIEFEAKDASKFDKQIDACIIDPPRKGCSTFMLDTLLRLNPNKIVYVSCNPDTMCKDLKTLLNDYTIASSVYTYNQFPRTSHVESIVLLNRKAKVHKMNLHPQPYEMIKSREKTIELRLLDEKRQQIKVGDKIVFTNAITKESLDTEVLKLHQFSSFYELYKELPLLKCGYTKEDVGNASPTDMEQYYSKEAQKKYGVIGIELCLS